jgi:hypothetical protein
MINTALLLESLQPNGMTTTGRALLKIITMPPLLPQLPPITFNPQLPPITFIPQLPTITLLPELTTLPLLEESHKWA